MCRILRQEFRPLFLQAPLDIPIDLAAKHIDAFYPLSTPFPAETELPLCRISLKPKPETGRVYITGLLTRLYERPQLEFSFEGKDFARQLNRLFADKKQALAWKAALGSTVREVVYSEITVGFQIRTREGSYTFLSRLMV